MKEQLTAHTPDALMLVGAAAIAWGARMIYEPVGWIVGGAFALIAGVMLARSGK